ncbi:MAG: hypothetical protein JWR77_2103 [Rhizorhabdus sp.]|nr:hypothetical protein [Rhizorhabdus sp.]
MIRFSLLATILLPSALLAQTVAAPKPTPVKIVAGPQRAPLSDEGRTIAAKIYGTPDPRSQQIAADLAALRAERTAMVAVSPIDLDRLEAVLRKEEALLAEARTRANDRLMTLLRALPEADRIITVQNMAIPPKPAAKPATTPPR